jgi:hypothetical protein
VLEITQRSAQLQAFEEVGEASTSWGASQNFLKHIITTLLVGSVIALISLRVVAPEQTLRNAAPAQVLLVATLGWMLLRCRQVQATIHVLSFGIWAVLTGVAWFTDGVRAQVIIAYPVVILTVAWMISARAAQLVTAMTVVVTLLLVLAESRGNLPRALPSSLVMHGGHRHHRPGFHQVDGGVEVSAADRSRH